MEPQFKCIVHEGKQLTSICINSECKQPKLLCDQCLKTHSNDHKFIKFDSFINAFNHYTDTLNKNVNDIQQVFKRLRQSFTLCIERAEVRTLKLVNSFSFELLKLRLGDLQSQQIYGVAESLMEDQIFVNILQEQSFDHFSKMQQKKIDTLQIQIEALQSQVLVSINKYAGNISAESYQIKNESKIFNKSENFIFSENWKSDLLSVEKEGRILKRTGQIKNGLTVYGLVNRPLNFKNDSVTFRIAKQQFLYMYFGLCDRDEFKKFNFEGRVYEKGHKMYAIRQNEYPNQKAITLHNSINDLSNRSVVPFDLRAGQSIKITLQMNHQSKLPLAIFTKSQNQAYIMPLDHDTKQFYPFVGMKFESDTIQIIDVPFDAPPPQILPKPSESKIKKKGFFGF